MGIGTSRHRVLRAQCSASRCRRRPSAAQTVDKGRLCQIRASPDAKQVERHHFFWLADRCAIITFLLTFRFFDSGSPGRPSININSSFFHPDFYRRSTWPIRYTGAWIHKAFIRRRRYIAVARIWTHREGKLGRRAWKLGAKGQLIGRGQRTI